MGFTDSLKGLLSPGDDERRRARETLDAVPQPSKSDLQLILKELTQQGLLRPEAIDTVELGPSAYEEISGDPRLRDSQVDAIGQFDEIVNAEGLDAQARLSLEEALDRQRTETRGARMAITGEARARGQGGSDMTLVDQLVAQQGAATRGSKEALQTAAMGQARKDAALTQRLAAATGLRTQDRAEASQTASAKDMIRAYNADNMQNVAAQNTTNRNIAQATNLGEKQRVSDTNVGLGNEVARREADLPLTLYKIQKGAAADRAAGYDAEAAAEEERNKTIAGLGSSAAMAFALSDERAKEDVDPADPDHLIDELAQKVEPVSWEYKGELDDGERHDGVMAQDLEQTSMGDAVHDDPESGLKMIDYGPEGVGMPPEQFALIVSLSKRLDALEDQQGGRARG